MYLRFPAPTKAEMVESIIKQYYPQDRVLTYRALAEEICQHIRANSSLDTVQKVLEDVMGEVNLECAMRIWSYMQSQRAAKKKK